MRGILEKVGSTKKSSFTDIVRCTVLALGVYVRIFESFIINKYP